MRTINREGWSKAVELATELQENGWNNEVMRQLEDVCNENEIFFCECEDGIELEDDFFKIDE
jgi:hypothetical protein